MSNFMKNPASGKRVVGCGRTYKTSDSNFSQFLLTRLRRQDSLNEQSTAEFNSVDCYCSRRVKLLIAPRRVLHKGIHFLLCGFFFPPQ